MPSSPPRAEESKPDERERIAQPAERERIAKRIARAGLCSRREAEAWIAAGRVVVDGQKIASPALDVGPGARILVDGKALPAAEPTRLFRYHKPRGLLTTARDPEGRETIYDKLPKELPRLMPVGRLDLTSEGLLLLTNDGEQKRRMELPATGWIRRYRVRVNGRVDPARLTGLAKGVSIEGVDYGPIRASLDRQQGDNAWLTLSLAEGKNREVRRVCEHLGWRVNRLIRIAYGPFQLGQLEPGAVEEVPPKVLREQLGLKARADHGGGAERIAIEDARRVAASRRPARPGHGKRPDHAKRPEHAGRPEHTKRPDQGARAEHAKRPDQGGRHAGTRAKSAPHAHRRGKA